MLYVVSVVTLVYSWSWWNRFIRHNSLNVYRVQQIRLLFTFKQTCLAFLCGKMMTFPLRQLLFGFWVIPSRTRLINCDYLQMLFLIYFRPLLYSWHILTWWFFWSLLSRQEINFGNNFMLVQTVFQNALNWTKLNSKNAGNLVDSISSVV
jgi:hypothetical protein